MNYLIIGGVAGGATVAARLRRMDEKANIVLFERGKYVSYANCGLPYYIGGTINNREKLFVQTVKGFTERFRIDIRTEQEVTAIRPDKKEVEVKNLSTGETYAETYDKLVLSPEPNRSGRVSKGSEAKRYSRSATCRTPIRSRIMSIRRIRNTLSLWAAALSDWKWRKTCMTWASRSTWWKWQTK